MQYIYAGWYPFWVPKDELVLARIGKAPNLTPEEWAAVVLDSENYSLRQLARRYGISHETICRTIASSNIKSPTAED